MRTNTNECDIRIAREFYDDLEISCEHGCEDHYLAIEKRIPVKIQDVPDKVTDALLAIEDYRYRDHIGIDHICTSRIVVAIEPIVRNSEPSSR